MIEPDESLIRPAGSCEDGPACASLVQHLGKGTPYLPRHRRRPGSPSFDRSTNQGGGRADAVPQPAFVPGQRSRDPPDPVPGASLPTFPYSSFGFYSSAFRSAFNRYSSHRRVQPFGERVRFTSAHFNRHFHNYFHPSAIYPSGARCTAQC
jgi:hypothetical protein